MKFRVIAALMISALFLCACGKNMTREVPVREEAQTPDGTADADETEAAETDIKEKATEPTIKDEAAEQSGEDKAEDSPDIKQHYMDFLEGKTKAFAKTDCEGVLTAGQEYSYEELSGRLYEGLTLPSTDDMLLAGASYAYIDCGNDGIPELLLRLSYGNYDELQEYLIFGFDGEKIYFSASETGFYRTEVCVNSCGYIYSGGSSGAASYGYNYYFINEKGERVFLYSINTTLGLSEAYIPYSDIAEADRPAKYPLSVAPAEDDGVCVETVSFTEYQPAEILPDEDGSIDLSADDEYCRTKFFSFYDNRTGEYAEPSEKFAGIYDELGLKYYTPEDCTDIVLKHVAELGVTDEIRNAPLPEWEDLSAQGIGTYYSSLDSPQHNIDLLEGSWLCSLSSPDIKDLYLAIGRDGAYKLDVNYTDTYTAPGYVMGHLIFRKSDDWGPYDTLEFYVEDTNISKVKFDRYLGLFRVDQYKYDKETAEITLDTLETDSTIFTDYYGSNKPVFEKACKPKPDNASDYVFFYEPADDRFFYSEDTCSEEEDITLTLISEEENDIIDYDEWFQKAGIDKPGSRYSDDSYIYELAGTENYSTCTILKISDRATGDLLHTYDFHDFTYANGYEGSAYVDRGIRSAIIKDGILYVNLYHSTYASSCPQNAYMMAIDMDSSSILWRSDALLSNSDNFVIYKDRIITGYGFTGEKDYLSVIDIHTGRLQSKIPVKKSPDYFSLKGNKLYVRTYSYDYEFDID